MKTMAPVIRKLKKDIKRLCRRITRTEVIQKGRPLKLYKRIPKEFKEAYDKIEKRIKDLKRRSSVSFIDITEWRKKENNRFRYRDPPKLLRAYTVL